MSDLTDKTILITGAGGVLGSSHVNLFLECGARVIATDLPGERSSSLKARFKSNSKFSYYDLDISSEAEIKKIFQSFTEAKLRPNVVVNNAAITGELLMGQGGSFPSFAETSVHDWEKTLRVNLTGPFLLARQMDIEIIGKYPCQLINVASMYALNAPHHSIYDGMPFRSFSAYSASKAGIHGLTVWLASYWAERDCTVNTLAPGPVFNGHSEEFRERVSGLTMANKMAEPDQISGAMAFLCSEGSRYMTGQILNVDGGFSAW
jgi:NAD(P)-dependent dehydrogenase (short-subunit alcohol dehydrogenase family)